MYLTQNAEQRREHILAERARFKSFHIHARQQALEENMQTASTLIENSSTEEETTLAKKYAFLLKNMKPPFLTMHNKLIIAIYRKRKRIPPTCSTSSETLTSHKSRKLTKVFRKRDKQAYYQTTHQLANNLRLLGINKDIVKDIDKSAATASNNLKIVSELCTSSCSKNTLITLKPENTHLLQGRGQQAAANSKNKTRHVPSVFKVKIKPVSKTSIKMPTEPNEEEVIEAENKTSLKDTETNKTLVEAQTPPALDCLQEVTSAKLQQVWCKENYNADLTDSSKMLETATSSNLDDKLQPALTEIVAEARPLAGSDSELEQSAPKDLTDFSKMLETATSSNLDDKIQPTLTEIEAKARPSAGSDSEIEQSAEEKEVANASTLFACSEASISTALTMQSADAKDVSEIAETKMEHFSVVGNYYNALNFLTCHVMICPIEDCRMRVSCADFVAHIYRAHSNLERRVVLSGMAVCFEMYVYPKNSFQAAIIMLKPTQDIPYNYDENPFWPMIFMGTYLMDSENQDVFVIWLMGINGEIPSPFSMKIAPSNSIKKSLQSTIFDLREVHTYDDILHSKKALLCTMDEIKTLTKNGTKPLRVHLTLF